MSKTVIIWICLPILMGTALFHIKHEVQKLEEKLTNIRQKIVVALEGISVAEAEWGHLTAPERLAELNKKHLHLEPTEPSKIVQLTRLRQPIVVKAAQKQ